MSQYSLSVLCHFVALAGCIRSGYVGGQLVITRNIMSFFFFYCKMIKGEVKPKIKISPVVVFHRRQLRNLFGIRYPAIISNKDLYSRAHTQPLSHTVAVRRFRMLGHVLRMPSDAPPQQAMDNYFRRDVTGVRGCPKSNLATAVKASTAARDMPLKTMTDLSGLRMRALDKQSGRELSA